MGKGKTDMTQVMGLLIIVVVALALTPTIQSSTVNAGYVSATEYKTIDADVSNSTSALAHAARNDSATYAWFTITTDVATEYGLTTIDCSTNITYTVGTKVVLFKSGVFDDVKTYNCSITYYWQSLDTASQTLINLVPLFWVTLIISAIVVFIIYKLKFGKH